jgi:hypothetical protein
MPNTPYEVSEYPTATQYDIEKFISYLDNLYNEEFPKKYIISELYTDKNGTLPLETYELYNLIIECENGILIASDENETLWNEKHRIHSIIMEHIEYITFQHDLDMITLTIGNDETYGLIIRILY